jgi:hypothetical protein
MTSCEQKIRHNSEGTIILEEGVNVGVKISYVIFKDHRYVSYKAGYGCSICHDPDCPFCKTSTQN